MERKEEAKDFTDRVSLVLAREIHTFFFTQLSATGTDTGL